MNAHVTNSAMQSRPHTGMRFTVRALAFQFLACVLAAIATAATCIADVPSDDQILQAVRQKSPYYFDSSGHSQLHIVNVVEPTPNWFVARVHAETTSETAKIILRQDNPPDGPLVVVAGPGTSFPPGTFDFPDAVRKNLGPY